MELYNFLQIIAFLAITVIPACFVHAFLKRYFLAVILATFAGTSLFLLCSYIEMGYLDRFLLVGLIPLLLSSFVISLLVGLPFAHMRQKRGSKNG